MADTPRIPVMPRPTPPSRGLAALLAAILLATAAGPAAAAVVDALGTDTRSHCERMGHTLPSEPPDDAPSDTSTCCIRAPEAPRDAVLQTPPTAPERIVTAVVEREEPPPANPAGAMQPRDTGPPPGPRRHLALSVLRV